MDSFTRAKTLKTLYFLVYLLIAFIFFHIGIFLRINLPFDSVPATAPIITLVTYLWLITIWWILAFVQNLRIKKKAWRLAIRGISVLILSSWQYVLVSVNNESFSRLFLPIFILSNIFATLLSDILIDLLVEKQGMIYTFIKRLPSLNAVNKTLYKYHIETFVGLCVGITWADYVLKMGLTLVSDSNSYMQAALRISSHQLIPDPSLQPGYTLALAATRYLTPFIADGASLLSAGSLVVFFLIFAVLLRRFSMNSLVNIMFILILGSLRGFINMFLSAQSEQPYTVCLVLSYYLLVKHHSNKNYLFFAGAILITALGMVFRYIGIIMGVMLFLYSLILIETNKSVLFRFKKYGLPSLLAFAPLTYLLLVSAASRLGIVNSDIVGEQPRFFIYNLGFYSITNTTWNLLVSFWDSIGHQVYVPTIFALMIFMVFFRPQTIERKQFAWLKFNLFFLFGYFSLVIAAITFTESFPIPRYWISLIFFVFLVMAQVVSLFFTSNIPLFLDFPFSRVLLLIILITAPLYVTVSQMIGIENVLHDRVRDSRDNPVHQSLAGFNLSPTAEGFSAFFVEISYMNDKNTIIVIDGDDLYSPVGEEPSQRLGFALDDNKAMTLLFKRSIIQCECFGDFKLSGLHNGGMFLSYDLENKHKELRLVVPEETLIISTLQQLKRAQQNYADSHGLFLIVNEHWFDLFGEDELRSELIDLRQVAHIDPYIVFLVDPW